MRPGGGHSKGSAFERQIAKDIVKAFKKFGVEQRDCWRSVLSGGHEMSAGDLEMTPKMEALFPNCVECKFHKKIEWWRYLAAKTKPSWKEIQWLEQAREGAKKRKGMAPLLVMKENRGPVFAMYNFAEGEEGPFLMPWKAYLRIFVEKAKRERRPI